MNLLVLLVALSNMGWSMADASTKPPYGLLTPDYGVVTEDDLAFDAAHRDIVPYDPKTALSSLHWQCFPIQEVRARYEKWRAPDPGGPANTMATMCSPEVEVRHGTDIQLYVDRRGHPPEHCTDFMRAWARLTRGVSVVCLNGDSGRNFEDKKLGKIRLWTWEKFKTSRGCHSYFYGDCRTQGCAAGRCPK